MFFWMQEIEPRKLGNFVHYRIRKRLDSFIHASQSASLFTFHFRYSPPLLPVTGHHSPIPFIILLPLN